LTFGNELLTISFQLSVISYQLSTTLAPVTNFILMRLIKLAFISVVLLFCLITAISLFIPSHVRISKAINLKTVPDSVWRIVDDLQSWREWNPFFSSIPQNKMQWLDTADGMGKGFRVENTEVRWKEMKPDERVAELTNLTRKPMIMGWKCIGHTTTDSITVQWYTDFRLRWYPWEKFASLMFERSYGTKMESGLTNLKGMLEK
jgi:hypothetical protein